MSLAQLEEELSSFTRYSAADRPPDTPRLRLSFEAEPQSHVYDTSYRMMFTITREVNDPETRPCIIHWDPVKDGLGQSGIILLCRESETDEWQPLQVDPQQLPAKPLHPQEVSIEDPYFKQLDPGDSVSWSVDLPSVYFDALGTGYSYEILWGGGEIPLWDWGTLSERSTSHRQLAPKSPAIVLPNGPHQPFEVIDDEIDLEDDIGEWSPYSPPPISPSSRMDNAPVLSIYIAGPETLSVKDHSPAARLHYPVTVTISYDAAPDSMDGMRPITFNTSTFKAIDRHYDGFRLYVKENDEWRPHEVNGLILHHLYSSSPYPVNVGKNDENRFQSLVPGESCSFTRTVSDFPKYFAPGDRFRYGYKGATLDWWDWGNLHDHEYTVVLAGENMVLDQNNGGRPVVVVPGSNWLEFTLTE
ncbi:hypothetical protein N7530_003176 [Penicillium desertorum]|uniref:Uncharacterized protein n=1 Tax=Penicillium desertorum TaxID=1303715 RepID=A0A9X0BPI9_9EURO|nr:hypothetical protein N7530_003176 [Penicillium desertorum]